MAENVHHAIYLVSTTSAQLATLPTSSNNSLEHNDCKKLMNNKQAGGWTDLQTMMTHFRDDLRGKCTNSIMLSCIGFTCILYAS
jgi:hypothetical protein